MHLPGLFNLAKGILPLASSLLLRLFQLLRNTRKTGTVSGAPPKGQASSFLA
jgi:hypothetical protein